MNLGVVTSVWGSYGRFIPEWLASIEHQTVRPAVVTIVDAGVDDRGIIEGAAGSSVLKVQTVRIPFGGMGNARNTAVRETNTEWVMHLDADDVLLPHALQDVARLAPGADVVSIGAERDGEPVVFPEVTRERIIFGKHGCFSCAAFRREFWVKRPFIETNDWVDSVFWVGLAQVGARFVGTDRAGFVYRQHEGSFSRRLTPMDRRSAVHQWQTACRRARRWL